MMPSPRLFLLTAAWASLASASASAAEPGGDLADFESPGFGDWKSTGTAFGSGPLRDSPDRRIPFQGHRGAGVAGSLPEQVEHTGTLLSPAFEVRNRYLNFLIWGQRNLPAQAGVELLAESAGKVQPGQVLRAASATEWFDSSRTLHWRTFDLGDLAGLLVRIRVNDLSPTGAIAVDAFFQSETPQATPTDASQPFCETFRPQFHFTARSGWLNDANGLLHYDGVWHLFHQHRPPGAEATLWGHATSRDLLHWSHQESALLNEGPDAMFSGSGWVDLDNASQLKQGDHPPLLLFYTLHPKTGSGRKCTQCLAFSTDGGRHFQKWPGNPLLETPHTQDRDPKVLYHQPSRSWIQVLSLSRNNEDRDHATYGLFRSRDLKNWDLLQEIGPGSWYWECPDFFEMPLDGDPGQMKWVLTKGSGDYLVGAFDGERFTPETGPLRTHWGACYYGAQSFSNAPQGRRIQIGWMNTGPKAEAPRAFPGMPFNQQMSFPRELSLRSTPEGPRLFRRPIPEIAQLWGKTHTFASGMLMSGDNPLEGINHDLLDLDVEMELPAPRQVRIRLRGEDIVYDSASAKLRVSGRDLDLPAPDGTLALRILLDRTSYELFANGGSLTHSRVFFPSSSQRDLGLEVSGGPVRIRRLLVRELRSIWEGIGQN